MTKKSVKFKMKINKRLKEAAEWWGIKQKIRVAFVRYDRAITNYAVTPYLMDKDKAPVCIFTDAWKEMGKTEEWYVCYHETGHIKFWHDGYPIPRMEEDEVTYPSFLNVVRVFPEKIFPKYSEYAIPLLKDLFERHFDHLVDSTLATAFKPEIVESVKWLLNRVNPEARDSSVPPPYHAFLLIIDHASYFMTYKLTNVTNLQIEEQIYKIISSLRKDLPIALEIFERAKEMFSRVRFTTDMEVIVKWIENMHSLMPEINFNS